MTIQIDAPTMWRINCDAADCHGRLYLFAADESTAADRAERKYGWLRDGEQILCRGHRAKGVSGGRPDG